MYIGACVNGNINIAIIYSILYTLLTSSASIPDVLLPRHNPIFQNMSLSYNTTHYVMENVERAPIIMY